MRSSSSSLISPLGRRQRAEAELICRLGARFELGGPRVDAARLEQLLAQRGNLGDFMTLASMSRFPQTLQEQAGFLPFLGFLHEAARDFDGRYGGPGKLPVRADESDFIANRHSPPFDLPGHHRPPSGNGVDLVGHKPKFKGGRRWPTLGLH